MLPMSRDSGGWGQLATDSAFHRYLLHVAAACLVRAPEPACFQQCAGAAEPSAACAVLGTEAERLHRAQQDWYLPIDILVGVVCHQQGAAAMIACTRQLLTSSPWTRRLQLALLERLVTHGGGVMLRVAARTARAIHRLSTAGVAVSTYGGERRRQQGSAAGAAACGGGGGGGGGGGSGGAGGGSVTYGANPQWLAVRRQDTAGAAGAEAACGLEAGSAAVGSGGLQLPAARPEATGGVQYDEACCDDLWVGVRRLMEEVVYQLGEVHARTRTQEPGASSSSSAVRCCAEAVAVVQRSQLAATMESLLRSAAAAALTRTGLAPNSCGGSRQQSAGLVDASLERLVRVIGMCGLRGCRDGLGTGGCGHSTQQ
ncbi:hypothetical protein HYH02_015376 [Chlamydomonas schloesseri]|uniref:Uncharacterized protein n=1 Tax=Chlamydomonas schloesseri TaxID=2026947 RepID=A0A835S916_9CHLO|nr:hypothetical protein HYH02_015376 [Chlamydomonas schloesseri]|eukprot:KAG2422993.1 hypothetical protein HYH02_015376 [Chlamydomonas schloesseri]